MSSLPALHRGQRRPRRREYSKSPSPPPCASLRTGECRGGGHAPSRVRDRAARSRRRGLWALFQRYDLWKEYAPAVLDVEIVYPGDADGNGLVRKVIYPLPFGRRGESFELVKNVRAEPRLRLRHAARRPRPARSRSSRSDRTAPPALPRVVPPRRRRSCAGSRGRSTASSTARTRSRCAAPRLAAPASGVPPRARTTAA